MAAPQLEWVLLLTVSSREAVTPTNLGPLRDQRLRSTGRRLETRAPTVFEAIGGREPVDFKAREVEPNDLEALEKSGSIARRMESPINFESTESPTTSEHWTKVGDRGTQ